ncbi:phospholipid-transporting ATPase ABCA3 [Drosophila sulfurigaster albostrigata]|uniref:phospholipid-transporting ATPase ABCA3 n=1 Tax=Drosophila sulfurigaster albostrigata TaxID=89887 RepID=UPI002D218E6A|nr:phospholipid-transporting ATPase ABCA3 [Drosophila sulfurigaster albostrigata]
MSIRNYLERFILLTWKLNKTQWNRKIELLWLIFAPTLLCIIAVAMRMQIDVSPRFNHLYDPIDLDKSWTNLIDTLLEREKIRAESNMSNNVFVPQLVIAWAPKDYNLFHKIINLTSTELPKMEFKHYASCEQVIDAVTQDSLFSGICFDQSMTDKNFNFDENRIDDDVLIPHFNYTIIFPSELRIFSGSFLGNNWKTIYNDDPKTSIIRRLNNPHSDGDVCYVLEGFIKIQKAISENYLRIASQKSIPKIILRRFPVDGRVQDPLMNYINRGLPLLIVVGYMFQAQILVWQIVQDKQQQMRLFLINMKISNFIHFTAWFVKGLFYSLISTFFVTLVIKVHWNNEHSLLTQTPWHIVVLVLFTYNVAGTSFSLMMASFFKNSGLAIRVLTIVWLLTYIPFFVLWNNREQGVKIIRYASQALPNTVLALICEGIIEREVIFDKEWVDEGYALDSAGDRVHVYSGSIIFLINALVFCAIGIYMDVWNTGESGGTRKRHIPAPTHSGDFTFQDRDDSFMPQGSQAAGIKATKIYEVEPSHRRFKIKIKKLCKRYTANSRGALNSFTWNVYENEVTVLMGHNGCGKTTLLKILAGLLEPTRGLVMIADYNIQTERQDATMQLGLALSNSFLVPDFTVSDQIRFICLVKGASWSMATQEIHLYTQRLQLEEFKQTKVKNLSAQHRSLLSIACAFAGGSPIILIDDLHCDLDLPTHSLICALINEEKSRRTIILVSNSTALANHLADRLAIMSNGELKCTGTKPFLRNMYGHGFRLTLVKGKSFDFEALSNLLTKYLPSLTMESDIGYKVTFVLENKYEDKFSDLFDELEDEMGNLDIVSFRLRDTSLDDIFLRFGTEEGDMTPEPATLIEDYKLVVEDSDMNVKATGKKLILLHLCTLLYMRWVFNKRQIPIQIICMAALLFAITCTFSAVLIYGKNYELTSLSFNLTQFKFINAFVEILSENVDVLEMHEFFNELLFWYDGSVKIVDTEDISDYYLLQQNDFTKVVNFKYMFGASFSSDLITVWFNNIPLHAAPFGLNLVHNVVARRFFHDEASIDVALRPLKFQTVANTIPQSPLSLGSLMAINLSFILGIMWAGLAVSTILERTFKKQQFVAGVKLHIYCIALLFFDMVRIIVISFVLIVVIAFYASPTKHDYSLYGWIFLVVVLSSISIVTLSYFLYAIFKEPNYAFIIICLYNLLGIIIFTISVGDELSDMNNIYQPLIQYTFGEVIYKLLYLYDYKWMCQDPTVEFVSRDILKCRSTPNCCIHYNYFSREYGMMFDMFILALGIFLPLLLFVLEEQYMLMTNGCAGMPLKCMRDRNERRHRRRQWRKLQQHRRHLGSDGNYLVDESVLAERLRVDKLTDQQRAELVVVCHGLGKSYRRKAILIRIDLCIEKSECVGLLGYNNTGKSTLVKLLVADTMKSQGKLWIGGYNMDTHRSKCYSLIGYCPQMQNFPAKFTPRELMLIHARLHGLSKKASTQICEGLAHLLGFFQCYRQLVSLCTTGQQRRIGFALAILGDPLLSCIDGPPGGIDPIGKRILYCLTSYMQQRGCSFLYTNLSASDCERMCQRTPVLFDGQLWTMGAQEERYRSGYLLEVLFKRKINMDITTARYTWDRINQFPASPHKKLELFMQMKFPDATLQHLEQESMSFLLSSDTTNFSEIFLAIRRDVFELNIEDFYITRNVVSGIHVNLFDRLALRSGRATTDN